jgi:hypothetical protein
MVSSGSLSDEVRAALIVLLAIIQTAAEAVSR